MSQVALPAEEILLADWTQEIKRSDLQKMLAVASRPGILSFALGLPAAELFPTEAYGQAMAQVLANDRRALQYGPPSESLKSQVVELMAIRGVTCRKEQILLTAGAQQGISLLTRLLLNNGGQIVTEEITYTGFRQVIEPYQPEMLLVPTNATTGMDVDAVEWLLKEGARPAFIYGMTEGHNPLGVSMSEEKRRRLVEVAKEYRVPIIEDDAYGFLYYENKPPPPMRALDESWVLYVGTFSKILGPALRVGWIVVPESLIPKLSVIKEASDIDTATLSQRAVCAYLEAGDVQSHLAMLRREYAARRDTMLRALEKYFPSNAHWQKPTSGLFIWVSLPEAVDATALLRVAIETERIAFIPGQAFGTAGGFQAISCLRLNFSNCPQEQIEDGIDRLARLIRAVCA
jgi:2-aminoadipate transaminase